MDDCQTCSIQRTCQRVVIEIPDMGDTIVPPFPAHEPRHYRLSVRRYDNRDTIIRHHRRNLFKETDGVWHMFYHIYIGNHVERSRKFRVGQHAKLDGEVERNGSFLQGSAGFDTHRVTPQRDRLFDENTTSCTYIL